MGFLAFLLLFLFSVLLLLLLLFCHFLVSLLISFDSLYFEQKLSMHSSCAEIYRMGLKFSWLKCIYSAHLSA